MKTALSRAVFLLSFDKQPHSGLCEAPRVLCAEFLVRSFQAENAKKDAEYAEKSLDANNSFKVIRLRVKISIASNH